jgi:hypothetical protein
MSAPAPAPIAVPTAALVAVFLFAVSWADIPIVSPAHCLQVISSERNCSMVFPGAGKTITPGPVGMVAHPLRTIMTTSIILLLMRLLNMAHSSFPDDREGGTTFIHPSGHLLTVG